LGLWFCGFFVGGGLVLRGGVWVFVCLRVCACVFVYALVLNLNSALCQFFW